VPGGGPAARARQDQEDRAQAEGLPPRRHMRETTQPAERNRVRHRPQWGDRAGACGSARRACRRRRLCGRYGCQAQALIQSPCATLTARPRMLREDPSRPGPFPPGSLRGSFERPRRQP
jgi:hypothetical protein